MVISVGGGDTQMRKFQGVFTWLSMQSMCNNAIGCCASARKNEIETLFPLHAHRDQNMPRIN